MGASKNYVQLSSGTRPNQVGEPVPKLEAVLGCPLYNGRAVLKDFDTYDFGVMPQLSKPKVLELSRGEWIEQKYNSCFIGTPGTGKPRPA